MLPIDDDAAAAPPSTASPLALKSLRQQQQQQQQRQSRLIYIYCLIATVFSFFFPSHFLFSGDVVVAAGTGTKRSNG